VHGGAGDAEQFGELAGGVLTGLPEGDEVGLLGGAELGLAAAQAA
jgi:hypothetical protein